MGKKQLDKDLLYRLYVEEGKNVNLMAKLLHASTYIISRELRGMGIDVVSTRYKILKRCLNCNNVYANNDLIQGKKICPICWAPEQFEFVYNGEQKSTKYSSRTAAKMAKSLRKRAELGLIDQGWHPDQGCHIVRHIVGHPIKCLDCPLEKCLEEISKKNKLEWAKSSIENKIKGGLHETK